MSYLQGIVTPQFGADNGGFFGIIELFSIVVVVGIPHGKMVGNEKAVENVTVVLTGIGAGNSSLQFLHGM